MTCEGCGKELTITPRTTVLRSQQNKVTVLIKCMECEHKTEVKNETASKES